jgi:hypothetical protein
MSAPMICGVVLSPVHAVFDLEPVYCSSLLLPCYHWVAGSFGVVGGVVYAEILVALLVEVGATTCLKWTPLCVSPPLVSSVALPLCSLMTEVHLII